MRTRIETHVRTEFGLLAIDITIIIPVHTQFFSLDEDDDGSSGVDIGRID